MEKLGSSLYFGFLGVYLPFLFLSLPPAFLIQIQNGTVYEQVTRTIAIVSRQDTRYACMHATPRTQAGPTTDPT